jgi:iron(III) transport system permease protein
MSQRLSLIPRHSVAPLQPAAMRWLRFGATPLFRHPYRLFALVVVISLVAVLPFFYLVVRAAAVDTSIWQRLWSAQLGGLLGATLALIATTVATTLVLGIGAAWLVERTNLPGRRYWRVLLALPMAIPGYVAALCWIILLRRGGVIEQVGILVGLERGSIPLPPIYNLFGATLAISLCVYPYIYLPVAAALRAADRTLEEAARLSGRSGWGTFCTMTLPQIMPAALAGALLVALYVMADFGTVSMLRYRTFTLAIYQQFSGSIDRSTAAALSLVLVVLTVPLLVGEHVASNRQRRICRDSAWRPRALLALGQWLWAAVAGLGTLVALALATPLMILAGLTLQGWLWPTAADRIWNLNNAGVATFGLHSLVVAIIAASATTLLAIAPAYLAVRFPSRLSHSLLALTKSAFALPGIIIGLSFVFVLNRWLPALYGTLAALLFGFILRLMPQAVAAGEAALRGVAPLLEQAAHTMGRNSIQTFGRVTMPLAAPGLLATWMLVFISAMKELPTAVLLRPAGFDTLPIRIWAAASESVYTQAAPPAFVLIILTMGCLLLLTTHERIGLERTLDDVC